MKGRNNSPAINALNRRVRDRAIVRRKALGITREDLAERIEQTLAFVTRFEDGLEELTSGQVYELADALEVPTTYFYDEIGHEEIVADLVGFVGVWEGNPHLVEGSGAFN